MGGSKATVRLQGKPLISYPLKAMQAVLEEVAVIAKPDTELPSLPGVEVWVEPPSLYHPLLGCYEPAAVGALNEAARRGGAIREAVAALEPLLVQVDDPDALFNVNSRDDLLRAEAILERRAASRR